MEESKFNRLVEPNIESLKYLKDEIKNKNCDFAIGFDCDADRVEILLSDGTLVSGNEILALITEEILIHSKKSEKTVVVNDATSYLVKEISDKYKAKYIEVEVGEVNVVDKMIECYADIGGEGSNGGVIIPPSKCRDGILTFLVLLKLIIEKNKSLKEIIDELPKYYYLKEKIKIKEDFVLLREKIKEHYIKEGFDILETGDSTGGLKAIKENSWIWFRQSKTEDKVLRIISDSHNKNISEMLLYQAKELLE
jgi:phosphomannomutase